MKSISVKYNRNEDRYQCIFYQRASVSDVLHQCKYNDFIFKHVTINTFFMFKTF